MCLGGVDGVFDIEEFITLLRSENATDICTIAIPPEKNYADYIVIVSGLSLKHIQGIAGNVRKIVSIFLNFRSIVRCV